MSKHPGLAVLFSLLLTACDPVTHAPLQPERTYAGDPATPSMVRPEVVPLTHDMSEFRFRTDGPAP
mgnify:CR=1 FL=1